MPYAFKKIGIAADHAGKDLKKDILIFLKDHGLELVDYGVSNDSSDRVDYPDFSQRLAKDVSNGVLNGGIAICGTGLGMCIVANKFPRIRATCVWDEYSARMSRAHNDSNILCLGGRTLNSYRAKDIVEIWLSTPFAGDQHNIRLKKIETLEKNLLIRTP